MCWRLGPRRVQLEVGGHKQFTKSREILSGAITISGMAIVVIYIYIKTKKNSTQKKSVLVHRFGSNHVRTHSEQLISKLVFVSPVWFGLLAQKCRTETGTGSPLF